MEDIPGPGQQTKAFWDLDEIVLKAEGREAGACGTNGPVGSYLNELFRLVRSGNEQALDKYVDLSHVAEGDYAEQMADQMKHLFLKDPGLVLKEWRIVRKFDGVGQVGGEFVGDERNRAEANFRTQCVKRTRPCAEISHIILSRD